MLEKYALFKLLKKLSLDPRKRFSIREVARETGLSVSAAKYCLDYLLGREIVVREIIGKTHQYYLNLENPLTRQYKLLFAIEAILDSGIINVLKNVPGVGSIVLYGSVARGEDDAKSDIDILVIARRKRVVPTIEFEHKIGKTINIKWHTPSEWMDKAVKDKVFYDRVIINGILLFGEMPVVK